MKNRLVSDTNIRHTASYGDEAFSRRSSKTVGGVTTIFVSDGGRVPAEYSSGGVEPRHYVCDLARHYSPKQGRFISPDPINVAGSIDP